MERRRFTREFKDCLDRCRIVPIYVLLGLLQTSRAAAITCEVDMV